MKQRGQGGRDRFGSRSGKSDRSHGGSGRSDRKARNDRGGPKGAKRDDRGGRDARGSRGPRDERGSRDRRDSRGQEGGKRWFEPRPHVHEETAFNHRPGRDPKPETHPLKFDSDGPGDNDRLYGINPVLEALRAKPESIERIYLLDGALNARLAGELLTRASDHKIGIDRVDRTRLDTLANGTKHQGVVATTRGFDYLGLDQLLDKLKGSDRPPLVVVLDGIQDPQNLGAIIRSAYALGAHGVVMPKDRATAVTSVAAKASAGAVAHLPVVRVTNLTRALEQLKEAGLWVVGTAASGKQTPAELDLKGPIALVIGAEGSGMRSLVSQHCDFLAAIPMVGKLGSLNASVSAAVMLYEAARQRGASSDVRVLGLGASSSGAAKTLASTVEAPE